MTPAPKPGGGSARRVFLLDDHPLVREWLAGMIALEPDLEVCGQADEPSVAFNAVTDLRPEVVVVDLSLPRGSGLEFIKQMRAAHPNVRLLVLSMHDEATVAERAFRAGAHGYAVKREPGPHIVKGIRTVLEGKFYASPSLAAQLASRLFTDKAARAQRPEDALSDREMEVFKLRGQGLGAKEIADRLGVSVKTVGSYEARVKEKLGLES